MAPSAAAKRRGRIPVLFLASLVFFYLVHRCAGRSFSSSLVDHNNGLSGDAQTLGQVGLPLRTGRDGRMVLEASEKSSDEGDTGKLGSAELSPPPPPPISTTSTGDSLPLPTKTGNESHVGGEAGTDKDQAVGGHGDGAQSGYKLCGSTALIYKIEQSGSEDPHWSLSLKNDGEKTINFTIEAPTYLDVKPNKSWSLEKDKEEAAKIYVVNEETMMATTNVVIKFGELNPCNVIVTAEMRNNTSLKEFFSSFGAWTGNTRVIGGGLVVLLLLVAACSCICYRCRTRKQRHGIGPEYEEVEMSAPTVDLSTAFSQGPSADGWDEVWDDEDWEDTEAARSSARSLVPSLSAKGLNSRRTSKDGWDTWET